MKSRSLKKRNLVGNCSTSTLILDVGDDDCEDKNDE